MVKPIFLTPTMWLLHKQSNLDLSNFQSWKSEVDTSKNKKNSTYGPCFWFLTSKCKKLRVSNNIPTLQQTLAVRSWNSQGNLTQKQLGHFDHDIDAVGSQSSPRASKIVKPITTLQRKGIRYKWTSECVFSFAKLKYCWQVHQYYGYQTWVKTSWYAPMPQSKG